MSKKQAVLLIHGIGEQKPMDTLRGFVDVMWTSDTTIHHEYAGGILAADSPTLNINTATAEQFNALPMIGPGRASDIVRHRTQHGSFSSVDELTKVPGIGTGTIKAIRPFVEARLQCTPYQQ